MAKVKNQIYDGSEESYTDASGRITGFGELFRQTLTDAYPLPSLNPVGVSRKSPRSRKPATSGRGSPEQGIRRDCFRQCTDQWNALPDLCEDPPGCSPATSKKSVYDQKQEQGVMCSYFDLFMGCCMSTCTEISITPEGGDTYRGGAVSDPAPCWPCETVPLDGDLSISYTTTAMNINQTQALHGHDSNFGNDIPCCDDIELVWELVSGEGGLSNAYGPSTIYTAPAENPDCNGNATIRLSDCHGRWAELEIAINASTAINAGFEGFYQYALGPQQGMCQCCISASWFHCDGSGYARLICIPGTLQQLYPGCSPANGVAVKEMLCREAWLVAEGQGPDPRDQRTLAMLAAGCCPPQLF